MEEHILSEKAFPSGPLSFCSDRWDAEAAAAGAIFNPVAVMAAADSADSGAVVLAAEAPEVAGELVNWRAGEFFLCDSVTLWLCDSIKENIPLLLYRFPHYDRGKKTLDHHPDQTFYPFLCSSFIFLSGFSQVKVQ